MSANQDQIEYWNGSLGQRWAHYRSEMDRNLRGVADAALDLAKPMPGERVLDIGFGSGETTLLLGEAVGPSGKVMGVDIFHPLTFAVKLQPEAFQPFKSLPTTRASSGDRTLSA